MNNQTFEMRNVRKFVIPIGILVVVIGGCFLAFNIIERPNFIELSGAPPMGAWNSTKQAVITRKEYARYSLLQKEVIVPFAGEPREKIRISFDSWLKSSNWVPKELVIPGPCNSFLSDIVQLPSESSEYHMYVRPESIGANWSEPLVCIAFRDMTKNGDLNGFIVDVLTVNPSPITILLNN
jgi:hypothetical protein